MLLSVQGFEVPVVSERASWGAVLVESASMNRGVVVPSPSPTSVLSKKKFEAFAAKDVPFANCTAPVPPAAEAEPPVERQVPLIAKQPAARLSPPVPTKVEVAVVKFATPCTENTEPGVEVPIPRLPFTSIVSAGVVEVAKVEGEEVAK